MSNNFEKFVQKNRREFDSETPSDNVWANIAKTIPENQTAKRFTLKDIYKWSAAAILVMFLTSIYFLYIRKHSHETDPGQQGQTVKQTPENPIEENGITPEYAVQFKRIYESVESQQQELKAASDANPKLYQQFEEDLKVLDSSFVSLKNQSSHTPNRDVLIKAMIQNLQLQAELLGRQLLIIKEVKKPQTQKDEKSI